MVFGLELLRERLDMQPLQIAIDGPVAAGKGDIAGRLAKELGLVYIYTGAMYRMLALSCLDNNIPLTDPERVLSSLQAVSIELVEPDPNSQYSYKALLDGVDVTERITEQDVAMGASTVSKIPEVREYMVGRQQDIAHGHGGVVMEGRDIAKRVMPEAHLKIYLDADVKERAKRRWNQLSGKEKANKSFEDILKETETRDHQDMNRPKDPLEKLPDHWVLDTTIMNQEQVVEAIIEELKRRKLL